LGRKLEMGKRRFLASIGTLTTANNIGSGKRSCASNYATGSDLRALA